MSSLLTDIQTKLEKIYEVRIKENVNDFVITDKNFAEIISNKKINNSVLEQLLIFENEDYLDVSLYLNIDLVKRLGDQYPTAHTQKKDLHDFWIVLEGVSHFLYLAWNAHYDRSVSQLELELQAEVDKFVSATNAMTNRHDVVEMKEIWSLLFSNPEFDNCLDFERMQRYQKASMYASQYCLKLMSMCNSATQSVQNELRRFYRLSQKQKISYIHSFGI